MVLVKTNGTVGISYRSERYSPVVRKGLRHKVTSMLCVVSSDPSVRCPVTAGFFRLVATVDIGLNIGELVSISATRERARAPSRTGVSRLTLGESSPGGTVPICMSTRRSGICAR